MERRFISPSIYGALWIPIAFSPWFLLIATGFFWWRGLVVASIGVTLYSIVLILLKVTHLADFESGNGLGGAGLRDASGSDSSHHYPGGELP